MSIGPRLPRQDAENCACGGIYVYVGDFRRDGVDVGVWRCGQCTGEQVGPPRQAQPNPEVWTRKDIQQ